MTMDDVIKRLRESETNRNKLLGDFDQSVALGTLWDGLWSQVADLDAKVTSRWSIYGRIATFRIRLRDKTTNEIIAERDYRHEEVPSCLHRDDVERKLAERRRGIYR